MALFAARLLPGPLRRYAAALLKAGFGVWLWATTWSSVGVVGWRVGPYFWWSGRLLPVKNVTGVSRSNRPRAVKPSQHAYVLTAKANIVVSQQAVRVVEQLLDGGSTTRH